MNDATRRRGEGMSDDPKTYGPFGSKMMRDWVLGIGEFSEENLRKSRQEVADRMVEKVMAAMKKRVAEAFLQLTEHDAAPAAKATKGNATAEPDAAGTGDTDGPVVWATGNALEGRVIEVHSTKKAAEEAKLEAAMGMGCQEWDVFPLYKNPRLDEEHKAITSDGYACVTPIVVWRFDDAPKEYQGLSPHGGDEDWLALVPSCMSGEIIGWLEPGSMFGRCDVSQHKVEAGTVFIGAHA